MASDLRTLPNFCCRWAPKFVVGFIPSFSCCWLCVGYSVAPRSGGLKQSVEFVHGVFYPGLIAVYSVRALFVEWLFAVPSAFGLFL